MVSLRTEGEYSFSMSSVNRREQLLEPYALLVSKYAIHINCFEEKFMDRRAVLGLRSLTPDRSVTPNTSSSPHLPHTHPHSSWRFGTPLVQPLPPSLDPNCTLILLNANIPKPQLAFTETNACREKFARHYSVLFTHFLSNLSFQNGNKVQLALMCNS